MVNPLTFQTPQAFSGGADFSQLSKLGDIYRAGQDRDAQQTALQRLGNDPAMNAQILIKSGVPSLAQLGISMQNQLASQTEHVREWEAGNTRAQAAETRAQSDWEQKSKDEANAAKLLAGLVPNRPAPTAAPAAPPVDPAFTNGAPPIAPSPTVAGPQVAPGQVPPSPIAPDQLAATGAMTAQAPVVDRVVNSLTSGQPAANVSREQIAALYQNPLTRPLATAFLQNQMNPGTWKVEKMEDGRLLAVNDKTLENRDVTPPTASGKPPAGKDQRERDARYADAKARGFNDDTANYVAINGKLPKEDLSPTELKMLNDNSKLAMSGSDVLDNLTRLKELSKTAWSGAYAGGRATLANAVLPSGMIPQGAVDTKELSNIALQNVAGQAKAMFGSRLAVAEVKLLNEIETTPEMSDPERQRVYSRIERVIQRHVDAANSENEAIRNKSFGKPGGGVPQAAPAPEPAPAPAAGKPSLGDFMTKAREKNPGVPDSELARFWKQKYGG